MDYITRDELDKILGLYEKLGTSEEYVGKIDVSLRAYQKNLIDESEMRTSQLIEQKISLLSNKLQDVIRNSESLVHNNISKEVGEVLDKAKSHITETVLDTVFKSLQEFKNSYEEKSNSKDFDFKLKVNSDLLAISTSVNEEVASSIKNFKSEMTNEIHDKIFDIINHAAGLFEKTTKSILNEYATKTINQISEFRYDVQEEMKKKVVDKSQIDSKFSDIEIEMKQKVQELINFQLDQARCMMEQSAKNEIDASLKTLHQNFLGMI